MADGRARRRRRTGVDLETSTIELLERYRRSMERRGVRPGSVDAITSKIRLWCEHVHPRSPFETDSEEIERWLDERSLVPRSRYAYISLLHGFFEWAVRVELAVSDPTIHIARPRAPRHMPRPMQDEDLAAALREAPPTLKAMITLGAFQGLRCFEIAQLQREQLLDRHDPPTLFIHEGKGGHQRVLPLHDAVMPALRLHGLPRAGYIFTAGGSKRPIAAHAVSHQLSQYFRDIGVDGTAHRLRHWFGTKVYAESRDLIVTQHLMGHASPTTTVGYVAFASEDARAAVSRLTL